ncbi:MAG: hypothetical protein ACYCS0_01060 [bacterium]
MSYNISMLIIFENTAEFKEKSIRELNKKIAMLDSGSSTITIADDGEITTKDGSFYGEWYDNAQFAELLSEYIVDGKIELIYDTDDGKFDDGFIIMPGKVVRTRTGMVPEPDNSYDGLKQQLKDVNEKVVELKEKLNDKFLEYFKSNYSDDFKILQGLFKDDIAKITVTEYLDEHNGWCRVVEIKTKSAGKAKMYNDFVVEYGNDWYKGDIGDDFDFNYQYNNADINDSENDNDILVNAALNKVWESFPYLITDYVD